MTLNPTGMISPDPGSVRVPFLEVQPPVNSGSHLASYLPRPIIRPLRMCTRVFTDFSKNSKK